MADVKFILAEVYKHYNCKNLSEFAEFLGIKDNRLYSWINRGSIGAPAVILDKCKGVSLRFLQ